MLKDSICKKFCKFDGVELLDKLYDKVGAKLDSDLNIINLIK